MKPPDTDEFSAGETFAGFRILRAIGRGGMGSVYLAEDERLRRHVAVKVIVPELARDKGFRRRFEAEARGAAAIEHPNVVPILSAGAEEGHLYLAMRYIEGENLNEALADRRRLPAPEAVRILAAVAAALDAAHAAGLVHRDVKPANILLSGELGSDGAFLTDFGLVRNLDSDETQLTRTDQVLASLDYSAPEQLKREPVDARTDVYALGGVLYRMLSGERPFPGNDAQKMWQIVNEPVPSLGPGEGSLDRVIARATAKDPGDRYPSAGDFAAAAAAVVAGRSEPEDERTVATGAAASGYRERGDREPATEPLRSGVFVSREEARTEALGQETARSNRGRRLLAGAGALALVAGIAVAVILVAGSDSSRTIVRETVTTTTESTVSSGESESADQKREEVGKPRNRPEAAQQSVALAGLEPFSGSAYSGFAPTGWEQELVDEPVTDYVENLWREPSDPENTFIRIDGGSPQEVESPMAASEPLVEEVRQDPEYREISYGPDFKDGREAARWVYELDGDKRADYFFTGCGQGLASVGSTTPGRYPELATMFREVAFSTQIYCGE